MKPLRPLFPLTAILFIRAASPLCAQNISLYVDRSVEAVYNVQGGPGNDFFYDSGDRRIDDQSTNGIFNHSLDGQASFPLASLHGQIGQNSTITPTSTGFTLTGTLSALEDTTGSHDSQGNYGLSGALMVTRIDFDFYPKQTVTYSLNVSVARSYNGTTNDSTEHIACCFLQSDLSGTIYKIYGYAPDTWADGTYPVSGATSGTLAPGGYGLVAEIDNSSDWNISPANHVGDYIYAANSTVTFTLNVTTAATTVAPPTITALTKGLTGQFQLAWKAPQNGTYRVVSSPDLRNWSETVAPVSYTAGSNVTLVNAIPGSAAGFYRIEYLH